ncbi:knob-associated His-rich protein, partial [Plasmodium vivax Mauritania I]
MAIVDRYTGGKMNTFLFFVKALLFSLLIWILNCSNYHKLSKANDRKKWNFQNALDPKILQRSLAMGRRVMRKPMLRSRVVTEFKSGGLKEYQENYETKHYKLKENVVDGNKECDEKYEAAQYGFKEKCPYDVGNYGENAGPDIFALRKNFPFGNEKKKNHEEYGEDKDDEGIIYSVRSKLLGSVSNYTDSIPTTNDGYPTMVREYLEDGNGVIYPPKGRYPGRYVEHMEPGHRRHPPRGRAPGRYVEHVEPRQRRYPPRGRAPGRYVEHVEPRQRRYPPRGRAPGRYVGPAEHVAHGPVKHPRRGRKPVRPLEHAEFHPRGRHPRDMRKIGAHPEHREVQPRRYPPRKPPSGIYVDYPQHGPRVVYPPGIRRPDVYMGQKGDMLKYASLDEDMEYELEDEEENSSGEGISQEGAIKEEINQEETSQEEANQEETSQEETNQEQVNQEEANQKEANQKEANQEETNQ